MDTSSSSSPPTGNSKMPPLTNTLNAIVFLANVFVMFGLGIFGLHIYNETPASFPTLVTPASWARFLIWPIILLLELVWVVAQLLPKFRDEPLVTAMGRNFIYFSLAQIAWTISFSFQILSISFIAIICMLVFSFLIFRAISNVDTPNIKEFLMWKLVWNMLFGWVVVATIVDINVLLAAMGVSSTLQFYMALLSLTAMLIVAGSFPNVVVMLVIGWALVRTNVAVVCRCVAFMPAVSHTIIIHHRLESLKNSVYQIIS